MGGWKQKRKEGKNKKRKNKEGGERRKPFVKTRNRAATQRESEQNKKTGGTLPKGIINSAVRGTWGGGKNPQVMKPASKK